MYSRSIGRGLCGLILFMIGGLATPLCGQGTDEVGQTIGSRVHAKGVVLLAVHFRDKQYASVGIVFAKSGQRALVAVKVVPEVSYAFRRGVQFGEDPEYFVAVGEGDRRQFIQGECLTSMPNNSLVVISAPADKLPPPVTANPVIEMTKEMPLVLVGYEVDVSIEREGVFAPFVEKAVVSDVQPEKSGGFSIHCPEAPSISMALVTTEKGDVIGHTLGGRPRRSGIASGDYACWTIEPLTKLLEPRLANLAFGFADGTTKRVVYEFVAVFDDPLGRIKSPRIHFQKEEPPLPKDLDDRTRRSFYWPGKPPADGVWTTALLPDATKVELTHKSPSATVVGQLKWLPFYNDLATYVARFEAEHPGYPAKHEFYSLVSYTTKEDNVEHVQPRKLKFTSHGQGVEFPGLDGHPVDYPRPVALDEGGHRLTSERTRLDPPEPKKFVVHTPKPSGKSVAGQLLRAGDADAVMISLPHPVSRQGGLSMPDTPVAFSADGAWLYYVDIDHVLHKISTSTFQEHSNLEVVGSTSLAYSSAGLLVAANDANVVWVVDPATLKVVHVIRVQGVHSVAASPASHLGFAVGHVQEKDRTSYLQLVMLDLKEGRALHRIKNKYGRSMFPQIENASLFSLGFGTPSMSTDGKRLYLAGHYSEKRCYQFRIDDEDLVFERVVRAYPITIGNRQLATRNQSKFDIYDLTDDETARFTIEGAVGFHPKTNLVYVATHQQHRELRVYDPQGKLTASFPKPPEANASRVLCHPVQDQAVIWGHGRITYFDFQAGRLPKALGRPRPD